MGFSKSDNRGPPEFLQEQMKLFHWGSHLGESLRELLQELWFRIAQKVVRCHSENAISDSENHFLNSESCSENTPELSESSENGLSTPRALFLKLAWSLRARILKETISLECFFLNLASKLQSRLKISISIFRIRHKRPWWVARLNSLEIFNPRRRSCIFSIFGLLGALKGNLKVTF